MLQFHTRQGTNNHLQGILATAFVAAAAGKLIGMPMMIQVFDAIGLGQWFRIVTALAEIGGAVARADRPGR